MARSTFLGNVRSSVTNLLGGVRGFQNLGAWALAGTVAYFLWVKPELDLQREQEVWFLIVILTLCDIDNSIVKCSSIPFFNF
jgi:hypothetical protein